jgi:CelD/BcsL family acetyltransferase involved in cellulose biosynthesis
MATSEAENGAGGEHELERAASTRSHGFIAEIFDGADDALAALEVIEPGLGSTGFQTRDWLTILYEEIAPARHALPRLVVVTDSEIGEVVMALPLVVAKEGLLRVARFADLGVSDCCGPLLARATLADGWRLRRAWRSARAAMRDVDLLRLERMPAEIGGRPNPLIDLFGTALSPAPLHRLIVNESFENYLQSLDKKYRKDLERCQRLWEKAGNPRFHRATTMDEIAHVFATLEEQRAVWHAAHGTNDILADPARRSFYERLAIDGTNAGLTELFALEANGKIVATLLGLVHDRTFAMLQISTAGEDWSHLSPGRLVVLEAVKHFVARGIRRFDLGINSNPLKHGFGTQEVPLYDLVIAQDVTALPKAIKHEIAAHWRLRSIFKKGVPPVGN